jgi:hypothetical protein
MKHAEALMARVPASVTSDASDVADALDVAGALWEKGNKEESIRWLKRAAEAAVQSGDASRAASLAKATGDLEGALEGRPDTEVKGALVAVVPSGGGRMRVSVKVSVRDPSLFLLRPLADGASPPAGTREGFLTLAEDVGTDPRGDANGGGSK